MVKSTRYNINIVAIACVGAYSYGFAYAVFGTSIGEPGFYEYFDLDPLSADTGHILGAISALFCAGAAFGAIIQSYCADILGRKKTMIEAGLVTLVGTAVVAGSVNIPMLFVFRFITGLGVGQLLSLVPLYVSEVSPPHRRGLMTAFTAASYSTGYFTSAWIGYGCFFTTNMIVQWRMPLCLCPLAPLIMLIGCYWPPESPRWLIWQGRDVEAWTILARIHHDPTDAQDLAAHAEFIQIEKQVTHDKETTPTWWQMFSQPANRKRVLLTILVVFGIQPAGINAITTYLVVEAAQVGLTGSMPLLIYCIYVVIAVAVDYVNAVFLDRVGRRRMLLIGIPWTGFCILAVALLQWKYNGTTNKQGNAAAIFFINLYGFGVGMFLDPTQFVFSSEIYPTTSRGKGTTVALFVYFVGTILYTAPAPTAFAVIGWRFYLVFVACDVVTFILLYMYMPETTGLTLEEVGAIFGDRVITHMAADGKGLVEVDAMAEFKAVVHQDEKVDFGHEGKVSQPHATPVAAEGQNEL